MNYWLILIPLTTAASGWLTISVAIRMLFYPAKPTSFAGISWQGWIPRNRRRYADQIASEVHKSFAANEALPKYLSDPSILNKITPQLENHIDHFLRIKLKQTMPVVGMLIGDRTINQLKELFMKELELLFPPVMQRYATHLQEEPFIEDLVREKLLSFSSEELRAMLDKALRKELMFLRLLALVIGAVVGLLQVVLIFIFF